MIQWTGPGPTPVVAILRGSDVVKAFLMLNGTIELCCRGRAGWHQHYVDLTVKDALGIANSLEVLLDRPQYLGAHTRDFVLGVARQVRNVAFQCKILDAPGPGDESVTP